MWYVERCGVGVGYARVRIKGFLIYRPTFLRRTLGALTAIGGAGWLTFAWPPLGSRPLPVVAALGLLAALASIAWFLVMVSTSAG